MALYLDIKYAKLAGASIDRFVIKKEAPFLSIGRCPICGDSKDNKLKRRFYFYQKSDMVNCVCHNCGFSGSILSFLKNKDSFLYRQYIFEKFGEKKTSKPVTIPFIPKKIEYEKSLSIDLSLLSKINDLQDNHPAKQYIKTRKIPNYPIYYTDEFCKFASNYNEDFKTKKEHPRIIIPIFSRDGVCESFQARALNGEQPKYYTVATHEDANKIFGIDKVNPEKLVYVTEGPIDSLYIPNGIAARSSAIISCVEKCSQVINNNPKNDYVLIWDNEPRKKEIVDKITTAVNLGHKVVIWENGWNYKDINEAVMNKHDPRKIFEMIKYSTFSGLKAKLELSRWKKI